MNLKLTKITKFLLDFMYFAGMLVCLTLPFTFKWYGSYNDLFVIYYWPLVVIFFLPDGRGRTFSCRESVSGAVHGRAEPHSRRKKWCLPLRNRSIQLP